MDKVDIALGGLGLVVLIQALALMIIGGLLEVKNTELNDRQSRINELEDLEGQGEQQSELSFAVHMDRRKWIALDIARVARAQWDDSQEAIQEVVISAIAPNGGSEGVRSLETMIDTDEDRGEKNAVEVERLLQECFSLEAYFQYEKDSDDRPVTVEFSVYIDDIKELNRTVEFYSHQPDPGSHTGEEEEEE